MKYPFEWGWIKYNRGCLVFSWGDATDDVLPYYEVIEIPCSELVPEDAKYRWVGFAAGEYEDFTAKRSSVRLWDTVEWSEKLLKPPHGVAEDAAKGDDDDSD